MPGRGTRRQMVVVVLGLAMMLGPIAGNAAMSAAQLRGKQIYLEGISPGGSEITAIVGTEGVALPASAVPCASCHGPDGVGRPEGGVLPPDIRWDALTKTYGHVHEDGRRHPAFDTASLALLLRTGVDPADNRLDQAMPLYAMSESDMADLLAYLQQLEMDRDPGIGDDSIQVATLLPLQGPQGALGQAMAQVMHAHFTEVNDRGGIFGRRIELLAIPYGNSPEATLGNLRSALRQEGIFALVGVYTVGLDDAVLELTREQDVPLIGPFTLDPGNEIDNAATFYLYPGFADQARVLANVALEDASDGNRSMVIAGPEGGRVDRLVNAVEEQLGEGDVTDVLTVRYPAGELHTGDLARRMLEAGCEALFFFGDQAELDILLEVLAVQEVSPRVYLLSSFVPRPLFDAPPAFHYRIFLAYPTLGSDISAKGRSGYESLARTHALPPDHLQGQIAAYAAARLLIEGARRTGRDLSRQGLVEALEALYAYETGLTPPLTYGPNRRIGARGAHVVAVDLMKKTYTPVGGWHDVH